MNSKTIIGTIAGGVTFFLLGWVLYGMLMMDYMSKNTNTAIWRDMESMIWWALILSNFIWAYFIALVLDWTNTSGFAQGMQKGLLLGLITGLATDIGLYANTTYFNSLTPVIADVAMICVMSSIVGGVIGMIRAGGAKKAES